MIQTAAVLATGGELLWLEGEQEKTLYGRLPAGVQSYIQLTPDWQRHEVSFHGVIYHGDADRLRQLSEALAERDGPIIQPLGYAQGDTHVQLERLLTERSLSINTAAAGGNASLMTIG